MGKSLFDICSINNLSLNNRFVRSATWEGMCDDDGKVTPQLIEHYRHLAQGGVGLIISGYTYVRDDGKQLAGKMGISHDTHIEGLQDLTEAVHQDGGVIFCQLVHAGGQTTSKVIGGPPLVPTATDFAGYQDTPREMTGNDISEIVSSFAEAAARAKSAGFDGVQLHGAHGYLINQFLSPLCNQRDDEYGGSLENRMRFLEETFVAVRSAVGEDFPVTIKLTAADHLEGGLEPSDGIEIARRIEQLGMDAIEVSSGTAVSGKLGPARQKIDAPDKEAYNSELSRMIKAEVNIPVIVVGGLRSGDVMQRLLWQGCADLFALSRPLIRQPNLPNIFKEDNTYTSTCISCNGCFRPGLMGKGISCIVDTIEDSSKEPRI